MDICRWNFMGR